MIQKDIIFGEDGAYSVFHTIKMLPYRLVNFLNEVREYTNRQRIMQRYLEVLSLRIIFGKMKKQNESLSLYFYF